MPFTASMIAGVAMGAVQGGIGLYQMYKGNQLAKNNKRPIYEIPDVIKQQLSTSELQALEGLPEQQRQNYIDSAMQQYSTAINTSNDRRGGLQTISSIQNSMNESNKNLLSMDAQARLNNIASLQNTRSNYATFVDKQFEINQMNPYLERAAAAQAMKGAGMQNAMAGLKGAVSSVQTGVENQQAMDFNSQIYKLGKYATSTTPAATTPAAQSIPATQSIPVTIPGSGLYSTPSSQGQNKNMTLANPSLNNNLSNFNVPIIPFSELPFTPNQGILKQAALNNFKPTDLSNMSIHPTGFQTFADYAYKTSVFSPNYNPMNPHNLNQFPFYPQFNK